MKKYNDIIEDQLDKNIIEKVDRTKSHGILHYIPHHAVIKPDRSTTKVRIVYDASAKSKPENKSLNEMMHRGPVMLHDLCGMLLRFRLHTIGIVADIEKAFLQVSLQPSERDATRFLWLKNVELPAIDSNIQEFRFCRVPFEVISSPFLLGATVDYHLDSYDSDVAGLLKRDIYMDNVITGAKSIEKSVLLYDISKRIFSEASMNLREWATSSDELTEAIPTFDRAGGGIMKVLGLSWNRLDDTLALKKVDNLEDKCVTKRTVLKRIASVFDPLGLFSPITVRGKLLLQNIWLKKFDWDDQIDESDIETWFLLKEDLHRIADVNIPRCVSIQGANVTSDLLCFCDASKRAYSANIYLIQKAEDKRRSELIFSKTRIAPTSGATIPRLELMGLLIGVRSLKFVKEQLSLDIRSTRVFTDSQCVLKWVSATKHPNVFVSNRVREIKGYSDVKFHYISSKDNPADISSRGCELSELKDNSLWWHGPEWILDTNCDKDIENHYIEDTTNKTAEEIQCKDEQVEGTLTSSQADVQEIVTVPNHPPFGIDIGEYSSAKKLLRVTAYAARFVRKLQGKKYAEKHLTAEEIEQAEQMWIKHTQRNNFGEVLTSLKLNTKNNLKQQLGIYMDDEGVLRCKGRLENACLTESSRVPILLPSHNRFTSLMIERVHGQYLHCGVSQTLSRIRYRFWIPRGRAIVKKVLNSCFVCRKLESGHYKMPNMPPLPKSRVSEATPFSNTGVDYLGPLFVKEGEVKKVWICLFTCMITRAVHLEIAFDMSTSAFLNCLVRFISCRGTPRTIVSDNAKHFKLANETLNQVWDEVIISEEVQSYVSNAGIRWQFIVQLAPWMGGFYERLVGLIKRALRKVLGRNLLTSDKLNTIVKQIEAVVNSRPLVYVGDDINSTVTITPAHFLSLNPRTGVPEIVDTDDESYKSQENSSINLLTMWKKGQKLLENFWKIWRDEYLQSLRERTQTVLRSKRPQTNFVPQEGDVVLIKEQLPRGNWRMGKIERLVKSADGQIRSAHVLTRNGKLLGGPICLLYPIETTKTATISPELQKPVNNENPKVPRRQSALKAKELIKQCLKE